MKADAADEDVEKARTKAEEIHAQLVKNPKQFAKLAKKYSQDPGSAKKGGDLGWVSKGTFVPEFEEAVASLNKNELSEPFQSSHGFHIVELIDKKEAKAQPYESVKDQIKEQKIIDKAKRRVKNQAENLLAEAGEKTLEDLATASDKTIAKSGLFDDKAKLNDIGYSFQFYKKLQGAIVNQKGLYTPMGGQNYVLYEVVEIKEPFIKPFEEVKGNAEFYALDEKRQKVADEKLEAFATEIKTSKEFDNLARTLKTDAINASFKFSDQKIAELAVSTQFKADVYKMKKDSVKAITDGTKKFLVYLVDKKEGIIDEKNKHMLTYLEAQMRRQKTEILMTGLVNRLATQVSVDYNMPLLNAMNVRLDS